MGERTLMKVRKVQSLEPKEEQPHAPLHAGCTYLEKSLAEQAVGIPVDRS